MSKIIVEGASVDELRRARLVQEHQDELRNQLSDRGRHSLTGLAVVTWALESGAGAGAEVVEWPQLLGARSWMGGGLGHVRAQTMRQRSAAGKGAGMLIAFFLWQPSLCAFTHFADPTAPHPTLDRTAIHCILPKGLGSTRRASFRGSKNYPHLTV